MSSRFVANLDFQSLISVPVCAVSARFYKKGILYNVLLQHARRSGLEAMQTAKSTATVQGFVILATWSQPSVSYETDNAYLYAGIAIRSVIASSGLAVNSLLT